MLQFENITLSYGTYKALTDINFIVEQGELVVLLGANGAGKTSIFMAASGVHKPSSGSINFQGVNLVGLNTSSIVSSGLIHCPEGRKLFPQISVKKNLILGGYVHRADTVGIDKSLSHVFDLFPILKDKQDDPAGSLSGGQQQMVAIGRALIGRPKLLMLDEPSLGLAPLVTKQVFEVIKNINKAGTTVILAEQNAQMALSIADRGYVIENGKIVLGGTRDQLINNDSVCSAYIGT